MSRTSPKPKWLLLINVLAALAYISCLVQWAVAVLPYAPGIVMSDVFKTYISGSGHQAEAPVQPAMSYSEPLSTIMLIISLMIGAAVVVWGVVWLVRLPAAVGKGGAKITHEAAELVLPVVTRVTHRKTLPAARKRQMTARIIFYIKIGLVMLPLVVTWLSPPSPLIPHTFIILVALVLALWSLFLFGLQHGLARLLKVELSRAW